VVAIRDALEVPVKLVGVGERVEDVQPFDANGFIDAMFESTAESAAKR
jgi:fused signal recognition particle receptor